MAYTDPLHFHSFTVNIMKNKNQILHLVLHLLVNVNTSNVLCRKKKKKNEFKKIFKNNVMG